MLSDLEMAEQRSDHQQIIKLEKVVILDLKKKSCIKMAVNGDENTFFSLHGYGNKNMKNRIRGAHN